MNKEILNHEQSSQTLPGKKRIWTKQDIKLMNWDRYLVPAMLMILIVTLTTLNQYFLTMGNMLNVLQQISILAIVSMGMTFVIIGGGFDLSVGSNLALTGSIAAIVMVQYGVFAGITAGLVAGLIVGSINGLVISRLNVSPFIATLGMLVIARGLALGFTEGSAVFNLPKQFSWLGSGELGLIPVPVVIAVLVFVVGLIVLKGMAFGVRVRAVGGNKEAARLSGIKVARVTMMTYMISGFTSGLAGIVLASRLRAGEPTGGASMELFSVAAVVLGGTSLQGGEGSIFRTLLGVLFIGLLQNGLNLMNVPYYWQQVVIGLVFILAACLGMLRKNTNVN